MSSREYYSTVNENPASKIVSSAEEAVSASMSSAAAAASSQLNASSQKNLAHGVTSATAAEATAADTVSTYTGWLPSSNLIFTEISLSFAFFMVAFYFLMTNLRSVSASLKTLNDSSLKRIAVRINSSIHAMITSAMALHTLSDSDMNTSHLKYSSFEINLALNIVVGYMIYDILLMVFYRELYDLSAIAHHVVSIVAFYAGSVTSLFALTCMFRLISEASTPFINLRWILLELKKTKTKLYFYNGLVIMFLFGLVRVIAIVPNWIIIYLYSRTAEFPGIHFGCKLIGLVSGLPLDVLNVIWYTKIVRGARKHMKKGSE